MKPDIEREKHSIFYNYLTLLSGHFGGILVGMFTISILTRVLGVENYGVYRFFFIAVNFVLIFSAWTSSSVLRFSREELVKGNKINVTFSSQTLIGISTLTVVSLFIIVFKKFLFQALNLGSSNLVLFIFLLSVILLTSTHLYPNFLIALGKIKTYAVLTLLKRTSLLILVGVILLSGGLNPFNVIVITMAVEVTLLIPAIIIASKAGILPFIFSKERVLSIAKYSWPLFFSASIVYVMQSIDMIYIKKFLEPQSLGVYALSSSLFLYLIVFPRMLNRINVPLIVSYRFDDNERQVNNYVSHIIPILTAVLIFFVGLAIALAKYLVLGLAGKEYLDCVMPFVILCVGAVYQGVRIFYSPLIAGYDLTKQNLYIGVAAAICNLGLNYYFVRAMGIAGAAIATTLSYTIASLITSFYIKSRFSVKNNYVLFLPTFIVVFVGVYFFSAHFMIEALMYVLVFVILIFIIKKLKLFNREDFEIIDKIDMPKFIKRACQGIIKSLV